jgi:hypothetical protein
MLEDNLKTTTRNAAKAVTLLTKELAAVETRLLALETHEGAWDGRDGGDLASHGVSSKAKLGTNLKSQINTPACTRAYVYKLANIHAKTR